MKELKTSKRIEYIDAMRGFTMFLVVLGHCSCFLLPQTNIVYMEILKSFRMPLFFFVSGFVFYKATRIWDKTDIKEFFAKKIYVQVISPLIFFIIYIYLFDFNIRESFYDESKKGFWFTFALFEYFILYILSYKILDIFHLSERRKDVVLAILSIGLYFLLNYRFVSKLPLECNLFGVPRLRLFVYFVFGVLVKKYFNNFEEALDKTNMLLYAVIVYVILSVFRESLVFPGINLLIAVIRGILGIVIVFALFRRHQHIFSNTTKLGSMMQFVGRRTLDIYLLHYFVLPWDITGIPEFLTNTPLMSLFTAAGIAILVIFVCLLISSVLRLHPLLAHYLFGARIKVK